MKKEVEIIMKNLYRKELQQYASALDGKNICFESDANFAGFEHSMIVEGELEKVYQDLASLEKADLIDFFNLENNGRANKKR